MDNQNQMFKVVEQGFHVTLGAISVATETLQNEQKRSELVSELRNELTQRTQEWEEKGEATATEARRFLEELINQGQQKSSSSSTSSSNRDATRDTVTVSSEEEIDRNDFPSRLQSLTEEVAALTEEMAKYRS